jgi:hypothetical protein
VADVLSSLSLILVILLFWPLILVGVTVLAIRDVIQGSPAPAQPTSGSVMS